MASNCHGVATISPEQRWSRGASKVIDVPQPYLISQYNKNMVEMDQNIATYMYHIAIRLHKWWWPLFEYLMDVAMQNAWLINRLTESMSLQPMDQLEF